MCVSRCPNVICIIFSTFTVKCDVPEDFKTVENGVVEYNRSYVFMNLLKVECNQDYKLEMKIRCNSSGLWSAKPSCVQSGK